MYQVEFRLRAAQDFDNLDQTAADRVAVVFWLGTVTKAGQNYFQQSSNSSRNASRLIPAVRIKY